MALRRTVGGGGEPDVDISARETRDVENMIHRQIENNDV